MSSVYIYFLFFVFSMVDLNAFINCSYSGYKGDATPQLIWH